MQLNNNIAFPVNLGTWQLSNGGQSMTADYENWDGDGNQPYAGGFAMAVFNGGGGSSSWNLWWVAPGQLALQSSDNGLYIWADQSFLAPALSLTSGSQDNQQVHTSYDPLGRFSLYNLGGGNVLIKHAGVPAIFRWDDHSWSDWGFQIIEFATGNSSYQQLQVSGAQFPILLLTSYGTGLTLSNLDLATNGYLASVAGSDFTGAHLEGTVFANLPNRSLAGCNFTQAHMSGANLAGCTSIAQATWTSVDLTNTDLSRLDRAATPETDFTGATLIGATLTNGGSLPQNFSYEKGKFIGAHLDKAKAQNVYFKGADFTNATLTGASLDGATFAGATLTGADFSGATLDGTDFTGASLAGAHFNGCDLSNTIFGPAPKFGQSITTRTTFINATYLPAVKLGLVWSFLDLTGANITNMPPDLTGLQAISTLFPTNVDFTGITLVNSNFTGAQMYYAYLSKANLLYAILDGAFLKGAQLVSTNLTGASMKATWLIAEEGINDKDKYEAAVASGAFLVNTVMDGVFANGVDFTGALFVSDPVFSTTQASAAKAYMNRATFTNAVIINASLQNSQLAGAHFDSATLIGSQFQGATITPTTDGVDSVPTMEDSDIRGTQFADEGQGAKTSNAANMDGLNMRNAIYSMTSGVFQKVYPSYNGNVAISTPYGATVLGTTTSGTTCPSGGHGPCTLEAADHASGD